MVFNVLFKVHTNTPLIFKKIILLKTNLVRSVPMRHVTAYVLGYSLQACSRAGCRYNKPLKEETTDHQ
jgi:hypothetical protein